MAKLQPYLISKALLTLFGGNRECDSVTYEKMALIFGSVSRTSSALRVQRVRMIKWGILLFKFHFIYELYLGVACWKLGRFDLESQTDTRNGMDFEFLTDFFESHDYPHNISLFVEIWSNSLWISMRNSMCCSRNFCRMWGATLQLNAISALHRYWNSKVSKHELHGLTTNY